MRFSFITFAILVIGFISSFLSGCYGSRAWIRMQDESTAEDAKLNNQIIMGLNIGDSRDSVLAIMGNPKTREAYRIEGEQTIEFLFYRTSGWSLDDDGDKDYQFTPFAFKNGKLIGWGRNFYDNIVRSAIEVNVK